MPDYVVQRLTDGLNRRRKTVNGASILLIGLAYKKNSGDCRESPALRVAELLNKLGANLRVVDSHVEPHRLPPHISLAPLDADEVRRADAVVILTDHDDVDYALLDEASFVLDTRNRLHTGKSLEVL
jgi:UDP-N-acetyl-D-glucosamine dehydrogenase